MADLTTLADAKRYLGVNASTDDALLQQLVSAASAFVASWCRRSFLTATYTEAYDGRGGPTVLLRQGPVTAVLSVTVDGVAVPARPAPGQRGWVQLGVEGRVLHMDGGCFPRGVQNVGVVYTAGFDVPPLEVAQATIGLVARAYRRRATSHLASQGAAGETTTFLVTDLAPDERAMLAPYVRVTP